VIFVLDVGCGYPLATTNIQLFLGICP